MVTVFKNGSGSLKTNIKWIATENEDECFSLSGHKTIENIRVKHSIFESYFIFVQTWIFDHKIFYYDKTCWW